MKAKRNIIKIDEELCNGCGLCVRGCYEGALQMIDGKARIVSELYCDGLGACIGECPAGAIALETREAEPYDEIAVMERIIPKGEATILAHLKHLKEHGEKLYLQKGVQYLQEKGIEINLNPILYQDNKPQLACGCPGSMERSFIREKPSMPTGKPSSVTGFYSNSIAQGSTPDNRMRTNENTDPDETGDDPVSQLSHWPVQLHLLNPQAGFFRGADVVLAADCTAYAFADFHRRFIQNRTLAIACPKLDSNKETYVTKIIEMIDMAQVNTITVVIMEVPCCGGLLQLVKMAAEQASRKVPVKKVIIGVQGDIKEECWI
ncbi:MAG: 4Fe-4S binding protein [Tannerella sp.]|jgi:ferredoxin|nr:4Fe-4S binding protein [Tannerella sp.]